MNGWRDQLVHALAPRVAGLVHNQDDGTWLAEHVIDALQLQRESAHQTDDGIQSLFAIGIAAPACEECWGTGEFFADEWIYDPKEPRQPCPRCNGSGSGGVPAAAPEDTGYVESGPVSWHGGETPS